MKRLLGLLVAAATLTGGVTTPAAAQPPAPAVRITPSSVQWDPQTTARLRLPQPVAPTSARSGDIPVTVTLVDRNGEVPADRRGAEVSLVEIDRGERFRLTVEGGRAVGLVPAGRYLAGTHILTPDGNGGESRTLAIVTDLVVTEPVSRTLDARLGRPMRITVDQPDARTADGYTVVSAEVGGALTGLFGVAVEDGYLTPTAPLDGLLVQQAVQLTGKAVTYNLVQTYQDRIPEQLDHRVRARDLAQVRTTYAASDAAACGHRSAGAAWASDPEVHFPTELGALPARITEYFTPGHRWSLGLTTTSCENEDSTQTSYFADAFPRAGLEVRTRGTGPFGPTAGPNQRTGDTIDLFGVFPFSGPDALYGESSGAGVGVRAVLSRNGEVVAENPNGSELVATVPPEPASFSYALTTSRQVPWSTLATEQRATWRFTSGHTDTDRRLPMPSIRYLIALDELNRARAGASQRLEIAVSHGSPRIAPTLQASFDDGRTWRRLPVRSSAGRWVTTVTHPADATHVSLRASARDDAGNTVDQTTIHAYGLAGAG